MCQIVRVHCRIAAEEIQHLTNLAPGSAVNSEIRTRLASNGYWSSHVSSKVCRIPFLKGHLLNITTLLLTVVTIVQICQIFDQGHRAPEKLTNIRSLVGLDHALYAEKKCGIAAPRLL